MSNDPFDALFGRFRQSRFSQDLDPNWSPQQRGIGGDVIEGTGYVADGVIDAATLVPDIRPVQLVDSDPTLPDDSYPAGSFTYNTVTKVLKKTIDGTTWVEMIGGDDIQAGAITADSLASTIVLTSLLVAGDPDEQHVEIDSTGILMYDANDEPVASFPTDSGSPVYVKGDIVASSLIATDSAEFRDTASIATGAVMTAQAGTSAPSSAPVLALGVADSLVLAGTHYVGYGGQAWYSGGPGWFVADWSGSTVTLTEYATDGSVTRTKDTGLSTGTWTPHGVAVSGSYVYIGVANGSVARVYKYALSDLSAGSPTNFTVTVADVFRWTIFWDDAASAVVVVTTNGVTGSDQIRFRRYDESGSLASTLTGSGLALNGGSVNFFGAAHDGTNYWVKTYITAGTNEYVRAWDDGSGAYVSNTEFGYSGAPASGTMLANTGISWDGTNFWGARVSGGTMTLSMFTNWTWTTASSKYWVCYSWYDPDGTTHETAVGPRASITMYRRLQLSVTSAAIPGAGGADDPDNVRIYMAPNATDPGVGNFKLQTTDALTTRALTDYASGGAADGGGTAFPDSTPGEITSASAGWSLKGDGSASFGDVAVDGDVSVGGQFSGSLLAGTESLTGDGTGSKDDVVTFGVEMAGTPHVVATVSTATAVFLCSVHTISSTGFTVRLFRRDGATFTSTVPVDWIAVYAAS